MNIKKNRNFKDINVKVLIILLYGKYQYIGLKFQLNLKDIRWVDQISLK